MGCFYGMSQFGKMGSFCTIRLHDDGTSVQEGSDLQKLGTRRFLQEQELWFPFGAHRMRYIHVPAEDTASRALPAVVFVHGLMGYSFSWRHNLNVFAQQRDVYAVDLLGIGHSDRPHTSSVDFGLAAAATRLLLFLHSLGRSQIDLVGTSHGGAVAMMA